MSRVYRIMPKEHNFRSEARRPLLPPLMVEKNSSSDQLETEFITNKNYVFSKNK